MLPVGGALHKIFRARQKKQAIEDLLRALLRFVDRNFKTPCPALGMGTIVRVGRRRGPCPCRGVEVCRIKEVTWEEIESEGEGSDEGGKLESSGGVRCTWLRGEVCRYPTAGKGEKFGRVNMSLDIQPLLSFSRDLSKRHFVNTF